MKILQVHNHYRIYGGEDAVLDLESELLQKRGHSVERFTVSNKSLGEPSLQTGVETVWSRRSNKQLTGILRESKPDLVHVHNTFPQFSPSIYWAAKDFPLVQTLHNYRLACVNASLLRDGKPCELCVGRRLSWPGIIYRCYRGSLTASGAIAAMQSVHRALGTFKNKVDAYIALTEFARAVMVRSGLPEELVHVKPNFVSDPLSSVAYFPQRQDQIVFVGRLSPEKGVDLLLDAWARLKSLRTRLVIVGDGPERGRLQHTSASRELPRVEWRGWLAPEDVLREIIASKYLVVPSRWYEGFPMTVVEALSAGTPVIAPDHGGFPEIVTPRRTGFLFKAVDPGDLAEKLRTAAYDQGTTWSRRSKLARELYLARYTPEVNYDLLMAIYEKAFEQAGGSRDLS